jgi:hypothetical protein
MPTMFTIKRHPEYPAVIPTILEDGSKCPEDLMAVDDLKQAKEVVFACYGKDAQLVPMSKFTKEVESRTFHTPEMVELLDKCDYEGVGLSSYIVYGARMRETSALWARIDNAAYIQTSPSQSGYHSYVVVPDALDKEVIASYELTFVSRPSEK